LRFLPYLVLRILRTVKASSFLKNVPCQYSSYKYLSKISMDLILITEYYRGTFIVMILECFKSMGLIAPDCFRSVVLVQAPIMQPCTSIENVNLPQLHITNTHCGTGWWQYVVLGFVAVVSDILAASIFKKKRQPMVPTDIYSIGWEYMDRDQWWVLMNTVINHWSP
jgi:hypothetical protein